MNQPDKDLHMKEVQQLAGEARAGLAPAAPRVDAPRGNFTPIHLAPAEMGVPESYVVQIESTHCENCHHTHNSSEFFAKFAFKSRQTGTRVVHLRRATSALFNLPVVRDFRPSTKIPFCHECTSVDLSHLPPPPEPSKLYDHPEMATKHTGKKKPKTTTSPQPKTTLDDLI